MMCSEDDSNSRNATMSLDAWGFILRSYWGDILRLGCAANRGRGCYIRDEPEALPVQASKGYLNSHGVFLSRPGGGII